ncbi:MAG: hypothetical protein Q7T18_06985 [Sedimentisphaerales bacterium]|nr:hypothetical protein [Sedimentisphaerales bacterium]
MFENSLQRHKAFWHREAVDRPLLGIDIGFFLSQRYPCTAEKMPEGLITPDDIPVDAFLKDCDDRYQQHLNQGDYPFVSAPFVAIPWLEAIAGCPIAASRSSVWAEHPMIDLKSWQAPESTLNNPWAKKLLEIMHALVDHSRGRYGVAPTLMRGPSDILSALRGPSQLPMDFIDTPELVVSALEQCARIWEEIARAQLEIIPHSSEGYMAGDAALRTWAPDKVLWLQEDAMSLLSPSLYREYILPIDDRLSQAFPCIAFHLHGSALWAIDDLVKLKGIDVIELNLEAANCDIEGTISGWKKIQAHKPVIMWRMYGDDLSSWLERIRREFLPEGLSIQISAANEQEAQIVKERFFCK